MTDAGALDALEGYGGKGGAEFCDFGGLSLCNTCDLTAVDGYGGGGW